MRRPEDSETSRSAETPPSSTVMFMEPVEERDDAEE
jgi:hypothetical protein